MRRKTKRTDDDEGKDGEGEFMSVARSFLVCETL
jgi:hypothetical protein